MITMEKLVVAAQLSLDHFAQYILAMDSRNLLQMVVLCTTSSLDNFAVGVSLGMLSLPLQMRVNVIVSCCNAVGALLSSHVGMMLGSLAPRAAGVLAALLLFSLGWEEADSYCEGEASTMSVLAAKGLAWKLAFMTTLNNLAGGVAGGLSGIGPLLMGMGSLLSSFGLTWLGHKSGRMVARHFDSQVASAIVFFALAGSQAFDTLTESGMAPVRAAVLLLAICIAIVAQLLPKLSAKLDVKAKAVVASAETSWSPEKVHNFGVPLNKKKARLNNIPTTTLFDDFCDWMDGVVTDGCFGVKELQSGQAVPPGFHGAEPRYR
eukprot:gnl/TRDRNA2_/TRDRNA2_169839_c0_seq18.p1 gnl/TRDRNA2_/TRDRNA2_169839_c0~~gnl/TRDRNA2_/TRDRNA2_169839_c0_seq18.p1  ORF type:complete len:320 (+),score=62.33 gnl/TRDRNA2_/TRDRNA2_169839_c0_seq18:73-1032(+)